VKDISFYFTPVDLGHTEWRMHTIGERTAVFKTEFPEPAPRSVALFTLPSGLDKASGRFGYSMFRQAFYDLFAPENCPGLVDLGDLTPGETQEDTMFAVRDVCFELIKHNVVPLVVAPNQESAYAMYLAFEKLEQTLNVVCLDYKVDMDGITEDFSAITANNFLTRLILHQPAFLFNLSVLGVQRYLVDPEINRLMDKLYFDSMRLGDLQGDITSAEPLLRNADFVCVDLASVRRSDFPATGVINPNGFYGEEICRLMRYAGMSDKSSLVGLYGLHEGMPGAEQSAVLTAQAAWHFLDGMASRKGDYPIVNKSEYTRYTVLLNDNQHELQFYKSPRSDRWWMEVPYPPEAKIRFQRHLMVPCTYNDYQAALRDEMPDLWWRTFQKLIV
jgi:arginase family enzyme